MLKPGTLIDWKWHETMEGKEAFSSFFQRNNPSKRRTFGLLERPMIPPSIANARQVKYKIAVVGKSGVGKSATIANLCGLPIPGAHVDTPGVQMNTTYWLARLKHTKNVLVFRLDFWDAGEASAKRFDHVLPACKDKSDAILFLFSHVNKASFHELPQLVSRMIDNDDGGGGVGDGGGGAGGGGVGNDDVCRLVMGTKFDLLHQAEVSIQDIQAFEKRYKVPVMRIKNAPLTASSANNGGLGVSSAEASSGVGGVPSAVGGSTPGELFGLMNAICEQLWLRDQILAGVIGGSQDLPADA